MEMINCTAYTTAIGGPDAERITRTPSGIEYNHGKPREKCPDCDCGRGESHVRGCDVERCSVCGDQWINCGHEQHDPAKTKWTGYWPGNIEAAEKGWFARLTEDKGWVECCADTPGARPDLNRWAVEGT